jgi:hypothetical protein
MDGLRLSCQRLLVFDDGSWQASGETIAEFDGGKIEACQARAGGKDSSIEWTSGRIHLLLTGSSASFAACRMLAPKKFIMEQVMLYPANNMPVRVASGMVLLLQESQAVFELPSGRVVEKSLFLSLLGGFAEEYL